MNALRKFLAIGLIAAGSLASNAQAGVHVDVNVGFGMPGYYGVVPIQGMQPQLWNASPIIQVGALVAGMPAIYLTVPDHERVHWGKYCGRYDACSRPVYFVKHGWYDKHYVKHHDKHWKKHGKGHGKHKHHHDD